MTTPLAVLDGYVANAVAALRTATTLEVVKKLTFTNTTGAPATLNVSLVKTAGSPGATSGIGPYPKTLQAGESIEWYWAEGQQLGVGDSLQAVSGTASAIVFHYSGMAIT